MAFKLWERFSQADNVFQALRPLTFISLLGLAPFRLNLNPRKEVQTSKFSFIAGIVHFLFFVLCFGISVKEGDSIIGYFFQTNITKISDGTLRLTGILAMLTIFGFAMFKRQRLVSILQNNIVVDEIFVRLGMKLDYRRILLSSLLISLGMLLFNVIYLCVSYSLLVSATISPSFVTFTAFALPHINISLMVFKFLCTTDLARSRFSMLNEILQDILDAHIEQSSALELSPMHSVVNHRRYTHRLRNLISTPMKRYSVTSVIRLNPEYAIKQVSNIHNLLCDICQTIEEYFTYPLLGIIAISFLFILFDDFYILEAILNPKRLDVFEADEFFAFFLMQLIWYIVIIVLIVEGSSRTILHSSYTAGIVHKILNITDDPELRDRLFRLSLQLSHRKVLFTAAGLFRLDRTLIFTISGAATCYLIILIQFRFTHHHIMDDTGSNSTNQSHAFHLGD
ncbi:putative gustatory receptor 28a [Drosophila eugracilis]|uniref:putative gustatory receptor 28a n=1 Tax=Drosophila eugracilis TaxID=29029 RepID=UPI001BD98034|nr:putative gustatory receptor 28a [Drosophila eugracilis]